MEKVLLAGADRMVGSRKAWLIVDDTALPKKDERSDSVAPQYASALGKNANCQPLVSLTLSSCEVPIMVGLRLFLPEIALAEIDQARTHGLRFGCVLASTAMASPRRSVRL